MDGRRDEPAALRHAPAPPASRPSLRRTQAALLLPAAMLVAWLLAPHAGAWPAPEHAASRAEASGSFRVLVFTGTEGFRHDSIPDAIEAIARLGEEHGFVVEHTEDPAAFADDLLAGYAAVVWLLTTGDVLDGDQQAAFGRYVQGGGGYVGVHSAADTEHGWPWYGGLVGATFLNHPPVQPGTVLVTDRAHPSTLSLPARWDRVDEWYGYRANPRGAVHVLATLDEDSYKGGSMGPDHPIAWCHHYDGGRSWYTGGGHTSAAYDETPFLDHLLGGIRWAAGDAPGECVGTVWANYDKELLAGDLRDPMSLTVAPDGRVLLVEREGALKVHDPATGATGVAGVLDVHATPFNEGGLLGIALDPAFETTGWLFLYYTAPDVPEHRLSRFSMQGNDLVEESEVVLLTVPDDRTACCHVAGSLAFGPWGDLYLSTGDNTNPFASSGFAPLDERPGREAFDAQRTAASTNDLRGKILRIHPEPDGTYSFPPGNLFPPGPSHRGEIFAMGARNPFRLSVDPLTGELYWADAGPDAPDADPDRGPAGYDEWNRASGAGNFGWPYCSGPNEAYRDVDFGSGAVGPAFDCAGGPTNDSPNNTGATSLPPATPALIWYPYGPSEEFPALGTGGRLAQAGPVYRFDPLLASDVKLPASSDGTFFIYEWQRGWLQEVRFDDAGGVLAISPFLSEETFLRPMDLETGPDGALYLLEWGSAYEGGNADSGLYRISHRAGPACGALDTADDEFTGDALDRCRWDAVVREDPRALRVAGGSLHVATQRGNLVGPVNTSPRNLVLQSAGHAPADATLEVELSAAIDHGFQQGGLIVYGDDDHHVRLAVVASPGSGRPDRIELRSEIGGVVQGPRPSLPIPRWARPPLWLRLERSGTTYRALTSADGHSWTPLPQPVENDALVQPAFGLYATGPTQTRPGLVTFEAFRVLPPSPSGPGVPAGAG